MSHTASYERGSYAKGRERRAAILRATLEVFSEQGYRGASMRAIAEQIGVSPTLLQHYFDDREDLLAQVITAWDEENDRRSEGRNFLDHWLRNIQHNVDVPGLIRLYTAFAIEATDPGHRARPYFAERYAKLTGQIVADITRQQSAGWVDADLDAERVARTLIAACEGLQIRWLHEPDFDLMDEFVFVMHQFGLLTPEDERAVD
jgi:AcrR family transcriptional regulator